MASVILSGRIPEEDAGGLHNNQPSHYEKGKLETPSIQLEAQQRLCFANVHAHHSTGAGENN